MRRVSWFVGIAAAITLVCANSVAAAGTISGTIKLGRDKSGSNSGHRTTARTSGGQIKIPGIAGNAEQSICRVTLYCKLRRIRLADYQGAGITQPPDRHFVVITSALGENSAAPGRRQTLDHQIVLYRDRNPVQRAYRGIH